MLKINKVIPKDNYILELHYSNNEIRLYDVSQLFKYDLYKPLQDKALFNKVIARYNAVFWGEIDIAPETLYEDSIVKKNNSFINIKMKSLFKRLSKL